MTSIVMVLSMISANAANVFAANYSYTVTNGQAPKAITLAKGYYEMSLKYEGDAAGTAVLVKGKSAKKAKAAAKKVKYGATLPSNVLNNTFTRNATVQKTFNLSKKTYSSLVLRTQDNATGKVTVSYKVYPYGGTLSNGAYFEGTGLGSASNVAYYKIKVTTTGYLTIDLQNDSSTNYAITLKNKSKKKALTGSYFSLAAGKAANCIPVKKGTYYLAVKCAAKTYKVRYQFTKATYAGGSKKSKATTLKEDTPKISYVLATGGTRWYKFKNPTKRALQAVVQVTGFGGTNAGLTFTFYGGSKKLGSITRKADNNTNVIGINLFYSTSEKEVSTAQKGTYYVKVTRTKGGCGQYVLMFREKK